MSGRSQAHATPGGSSFELDRFELVGERYEVEGRWSGVRGRVFIRPELTLTDGSQSRRLLADLDQKPWQAAEGDHWAVAFPCSGDAIDPTDAELTVAPDITVAVKRGRTRRTRTNHKDAGQSPGARARRTPKPRAETEARSETAGKRRGLGVQLAEAQNELEQVRNEHGRLSDRLDAAMRRAEDARAERDRATQSREQLIAERDDAIGALDDARAERDRALLEAAAGLKVVQRSRDEALAELEHVRSELERAQGALHATAAERDSAIRAGTEVERELHAAHAERANLIKDREQLVAEQSILQSEPPRGTVAPNQVRAENARHHPAERRQPDLQTQTTTSSNFVWNQDDGWRSSTRPELLNRVAALLALAAAVVVVLVLVLVVF